MTADQNSIHAKAEPTSAGEMVFSEMSDRIYNSENLLVDTAILVPAAQYERQVSDA